jgi:hypothetical protein
MAAGDRRGCAASQLESALPDDHDLVDEPQTAALAALRERLASDRLVLAFVAEFSRGKSELINAIFFADAGRRVLPATPGRTTMCPVELATTPHGAARGCRCCRSRPGCAACRWPTCASATSPGSRCRWTIDNPDGAGQALQAVTRTQRVSVERPRALGFWSDEQPEDNPPLAADGTVEVPAWRHALINYPHPLLKRGLVVIDTPGLNAIGAEPELTLGLLPTAHAIVFVLAADTGVTKSDLAIWRDHLGDRGARALRGAEQDRRAVRPAGIRRRGGRRRSSASAAASPPDAGDAGVERVFALSAREALAARVQATTRPAAQRLGALEAALPHGLLPRQRELLAAGDAVACVERAAPGASAAWPTAPPPGRAAARTARPARQERRQGAADAAARGGRAAEFERCAPKLQALRVGAAAPAEGGAGAAVQRRCCAPRWRDAAGAARARPFNLGAARRPSRRCERGCGRRWRRREQQADEIRQMLDASFMQLNAEYGFRTFAAAAAPGAGALHRASWSAHRRHNYSRYLGLTQAWRMAAAGLPGQFRRMLLSKLRVVFEGAASELELWSKASNQIDTAAARPPPAFVQRREALQRIQPGRRRTGAAHRRGRIAGRSASAWLPVGRPMSTSCASEAAGAPPLAAAPRRRAARRPPQLVQAMACRSRADGRAASPMMPA